MLGVDARDGLVATEGWAETSDLPALELAHRFEQAGAAALIYTDISRDGMGQGVNIAATLDLARRIATPVIASGGIGGADHLRALARDGAGVVAGVIIGRALYDGSLDAAEALSIASE